MKESILLTILGLIRKEIKSFSAQVQKNSDKNQRLRIEGQK